MKKLWISAGLTVKAGQSTSLVAEELRILQQATEHEPGCIEFVVHQNIENPERFTLWECWQNEDALTAHFKQEHTQKYVQQELTDVVYIEKLHKVE